MKEFLFIVLSLSACTLQPKSEPTGIGKYHQLNLQPLNDSLSMIGKKIFEEKCFSCHKMEYKNTGPDLSDIMSRRKPEWIMNFMFNMKKMKKNEATAYDLDMEYPSVNCRISLSESEAKNVLEYFRLYQIWLHEINVK